MKANELIIAAENAYAVYKMTGPREDYNKVGSLKTHLHNDCSLSFYRAGYDDYKKLKEKMENRMNDPHSSQDEKNLMK